MNYRPHYHACLFNHDFEDKTLWTTRNGVKLYHSEILNKLWGKGFATTGDVTFESAAYVARYITKKITGEQAEQHYTRIDDSTGEILHVEPEYTTMSRRPGIGKGWYDKFKTDVYPSDQIIINGKPVKPPKYYDSLYELEDPALHADLKTKRITSINQEDQTPDRLHTREVVKLAAIKSLKRDL